MNVRLKVLHRVRDSPPHSVYFCSFSNSSYKEGIQEEGIKSNKSKVRNC